MGKILGEKAKTRLYLFIGSVLIVFMVAGFLVILNINEPAEYTSGPFRVLWILTLIACMAMAFFFLKGPVFSLDGKLEAANMNAMLLAVLVVIQLSFFFEIVSVRNQIANYDIYSNIRSCFDRVQKCKEEELEETLALLCDGEIIEEIWVSSEEGKVLYSSNPEQVGGKSKKTKYNYLFSNDMRISFLVNQSYIINQLKSLLLNLLTILVTSIFFTVEIVLLMTRVVSRQMDETPQVRGEARTLSSLYYIRQISFLFYFASRLSSAFIPIMAKSLYNPFHRLTDMAAAGLPQSAETLFTCSAIFLTTLLLERKGWKLPFIAGLLMVALGTFLSALSGNLLVFILARSVVGLGYGFVWMTLRNLSLFGRDDKAQLLGFALLNAGIYAGMNCGASLGAILAEIFGYKTVFFISAALTLLSSLFIVRMENARLPQKKVREENGRVKGQKEKGSYGQILIAFLFTVLMIWPASVAGSYISYYLPLYFETIGRSVTDVGRVQLLYGLVIVYGGPALAVAASSSSSKGDHLRNGSFVYNLMISLSLFLSSLGSGLLLPFVGAALLGAADSFGFGVHNSYFLSMPIFRRMGKSKALSLLSFIKKIFEMTGPLVFAAGIVLGYQIGIRSLGILFVVLAVLFMVCCAALKKEI